MAPPRATPDFVETSLTGLGLLSTPIFNKGTAFTEAERDLFSLHGLLPPQVGDLDQQVARRMKAFHALSDDFARYTFMRDLQDVNETLFYALITRNVEEMLPVVYTPAVGEGCQRFSEIWRKPRGVFLSYPNRDRIETILGHPRYDGVRCIVVSDGERILGLGDQGAGGMGIPIGKLALYTALAGVHPLSCLPVFLDVGTDNAERIADPLYLGWKNERVRGKEYDQFVDRFVRVVKKRWPHVLLQWEDFAGHNAGRLLDRYRDALPSFNDDIQGTAAVATATVLAAVNVTGVPLQEQRFAVLGFGSAGRGIAGLLCSALMQAGLSEREAHSRFYAVDKDGLLVEGMDGLRAEQAPFAQTRGAVADWQRGENGIGLLEVMERAKPTVLIGVSGQPGAFTEEVVRAMARGVSRPVIFPLSNPTSRSEAHPADLLQWTEGRAIIGTGSPFGSVEYAGTQHRIAQTNNSYIFPGLALGILSARAKRVSDSMIMAAAQALAVMSPTAKDPNGALLPPLEQLREVSVGVALAVGRQAAAEGLAAVRGDAFEEALRANVWEPVYLPYRRRK
ncbi:NAD-dependent malic enzyme [Granulicella sp. S156]|jgi:malate dehydrogenase (oxaloacetate-decarboxylating)|uniref:NAD-dependent malic enzyme n=1 Tax=Granulicella sp. S156 TaxID=1747224 RepID=UPI00131BDB70|nr:NAD-dependent malic enzyme [Granulicella sp. S156]